MKLPLTILLLFALKAHAQIPCYLVLQDTTHFWNYYNKSGVLAWRNVKGYDATLIPKGGSAIKQDLATHTVYTDEGFKIVTVLPDSSVSIKYLDKNKQPIDRKYISAWPFDVPKNGF